MASNLSNYKIQSFEVWFKFGENKKKKEFFSKFG